MPISWASPRVQSEKSCAEPSSRSHALNGLQLPPIPKRWPSVDASYAYADQGITSWMLSNRRRSQVAVERSDPDWSQDPSGSGRIAVAIIRILRRCRTSSSAGPTADIKDRSRRSILKTSASGQFLTSAKNMKI